MLRREDAVSEVVGYVLIASIVIASLSFLAAVAFPLLTEVQEDTSFTRGQNGLASFQRDMEAVSRGPVGARGSSRTTVLTLGSGTLTIDNESGGVEVDFSVATSSLTGNVSTVDNSTNFSVEGARVTLVGTRYSTTTGDDGRYSLSVPVGETYTVRVDRDGFVGQEDSLFFDQGDSMDFVLNVSNGTVASRVENSSGSYIEGVDVTVNGTPYGYDATGRGGEYFDATNTTVSSGRANFTGVPTGENYTVTFEKEWYVTEERRRVVVRNDSTTALNVSLDMAGRAKVNVTNGTGVPVENASVTIYNRSNSFAVTNATNSLGSSTFYGVPVGGYTAVVHSPGYAPNSTPVSVSFQEQANETVVLGSAGSNTWNLSGTVHDSINESFGIENAWVNYTYDGTDVVAATDEDGGYEMSVVNGTYTFTADSADYEPDSTQIAVDSDSVHSFSLDLDEVEFFHGYVKNETGSTAPDATVTVRGETDAGWSFRERTKPVRGGTST